MLSREERKMNLAATVLGGVAPFLQLRGGDDFAFRLALDQIYWPMPQYRLVLLS